MLSREDISAIARRLEHAETTRTQIRMVSLDHPGMTIDDAYAVQRTWIERKVSQGRVLKGHKIGLTSKAMQNAVNIREPDYGVLLDDMFFYDGASIPTDRFIGMRVEAELAFVLKEQLTGPDCTIFDVLNATDYVTPALEILDTRIFRTDPETKATRQIVDTISDNAANAGVVIGGRAFKPLDVDIRWVAALCYRNGQLEETGVAAGVLNHPANAVAWLANKLHVRGIPLEPRQVILSGSFIRPLEARKGDTFHADYGPFGSVSCYFA